MATKKLQILADLCPSDEEIKTTVEDYFVDYPIDSTTLDKLCPALEESGSVVICNPVEGYPLSAQADEATTIYRAGKNLIANSNIVYGYELYTEKGTLHAKDTWYVIDYVPVKPSTTYTKSGLSSSTNVYYDADKVRLGSEYGNTFTTPENCYFVRFNSLIDGYATPQLEVGSTITEYEVGRGIEEFAVGETIPALSGVNTLWADTGEITVTGRADPIVVIEKLTNAIIALGGNV